jgi:signal transduction histidine kinase/CheY-like chemotaxis protein
VVLVLGLGSVATLAGAEWIRERLILQDFALAGAVGEVQRRVATVHLWLEEYVTGDEVPQGEMLLSLDRARRLVDAMIAGGEVDGGRFRLEPLADRRALVQASAVRARLEEFDTISRQRKQGYDRGLQVGIGSPVDTEYDRVFDRLITESLGLEETIAGGVERSLRRARILSRAIVIAWTAIVALAVGGLWTRERRRLAAEEALAASREQLLQAQKLEAIGRLAGGIAHDINNYLAAITAQCERVKMKTAPGDPVAERMDQAVETAFKASSLIRRLLAFSRPQPVRREVVDLNEVMVSLEPMMRRLLGEDVVLETRLAPGLWPVELDPSQLEQVLVNLLVNAREAMPAGGRAVVDTANLRSEPGAGGNGGEMVVVTVTDTGVGIRPEVRDKIFEPFVTTKSGTGSSGLGLATVYAVVTGAGGRLRVDSELGEGTEITVYLPRSRSEPIARPPRRVAEALPRGSESLLLIEDNDDLRESMRTILADLGYRVRAAAGAAEALAVFEQIAEEVDLVISDVVMPETSGPQVVDRLRQRRPGLAVLFISGTAGNLILRHGLRRGEFDLLEKPFSAETLARTVRELLDREPAAPPDPAAG